MDVENDFIKPIVLSYYNKGLSELEACKEIAVKYGQYGITTRTISRWYRRLKLEEDCLSKKSSNSINGISDNFLIDLVDKNPDLNMTELGKLAGTSASTVSKRLKQINRYGEKVKYKHKSNGRPIKITNEFLINLVKENPELTMQELGELVGMTASNISLRLSNIKRKGEKLELSDENHKSSKSNESNKSKTKITKQQIIGLINENPDLSVKELAKLANVSTRAISNQLKSISVEDMKVSYDVSNDPHKRSDNPKCNLANYNPDLNMEELPELKDNSAKTLSRGLNQLNFNEEVDNCGKNKKALKTIAYFTDEFLIDLINNNPDLNLTELGILAGTSGSTISKRLKEINSDGEKVKYKLKSKGQPKKFTDEFLINLAEKNPGISTARLASLAGVSVPAVTKRISKINSAEERIKTKSNEAYPKIRLTKKRVIDLINENPELNMEELAELANVSAKTLSDKLKKIKENKDVGYQDKKVAQKYPDDLIINLVNDNPDLNLAQIGKLAGINSSIISRRLKKINGDGEKVKYEHKARGKPKTFTDELLIDLADKNPGISISRLASLVGASASVVSRRINTINSAEERIKINYKKQRNQSIFTDEFLINLVNENPQLTMQELGKLAGVAVSTISVRLSKIKSKGEALKYSYKYCKHDAYDEGYPKTRLTKQRVIDLINENPELNMAELAKLANVSTVAISYHIKKINCTDGGVNYIYKKIRKVD